MFIYKTLAKNKNGKIILVTIKIYDKETSGVLMELEIPVDEEGD